MHSIAALVLQGPLKGGLGREIDSRNIHFVQCCSIPFNTLKGVHTLPMVRLHTKGDVAEGCRKWKDVKDH